MNNKLASTPKDHRLAIIKTVAVDPMIAGMVKGAAYSDQQGTENYGEVDHAFYWGPPVDGQALAQVGDCIDESHFGVRDRKTKKIESVGIPRRDLRITLRKVGATWRVEQFQHLGDGKC